MRLLRLLYTWYNSLSLCFPCLSNPAQVRNSQYGTHELIPKKCQNPYVFILTSFLTLEENFLFLLSLIFYSQANILFEHKPSLILIA